MTEPQTKEIEKVKPSSMQFSNRGLILQTVTDLATFAKKAFESGLVPDSFRTPEQVFIALQMGAELGLPPMATLRTICVINGRPSIWGDGMMGVVRASRLLTSCDEFIEGQGEQMVAVCRTTRKDDGTTIERTFSVDDAKLAKLWMNPKKDPWCKYPKRMLQMRARAFCLRDHFADILSGMTSAEEAMDMGNTQEAFDPDKARGADKAVDLAHRLTSDAPVVAESEAQPVEESEQQTEQSESAPHPTQTTDPTPTTSDGQPQSETASETTPPDAEGDTSLERFERLVNYIAGAVGSSLADAEQAATDWLAGLNFKRTDLADPERWLRVWNKAQSTDWTEKVKAAA